MVKFHTVDHRLLLITLFSVVVSGCSFSPRDSGPKQPMDFSHLGDATPKHEKRTRAGNPPTYVVLGKRYYVMEESTGFVERGIASWYGKKFHGRKTSNGETYNMYAMTAAHKTLPIPSYLQVTNLDNGKSVVVRVNDRGPFHEGRIVDLSYAAASKLGIAQNGTGRVEIRAIEPGEGKDKTTITATAPTQKPAPTPLPSSTPEPNSNQLFLQLGSFISQYNAESLRAQLALNNVTGAEVQRIEIDRKNIYRVRIGPITSIEEADSLATRISDLGMGVPSIIID
ncbi:MAG: septal ring lytic transglycosylase RlpA family protein [Chromatiales bacterium]|nr:septal ring lytic transglycosylase RlpA family protein [Chromatiales bacterium]